MLAGNGSAQIWSKESVTDEPLEASSKLDNRKFAADVIRSWWQISNEAWQADSPGGSGTPGGLT